MLGSGFHAMDPFVSGMDSGLKSLAGFHTPWAEFRIPAFHIPLVKISWIPEYELAYMVKKNLESVQG